VASARSDASGNLGCGLGLNLGLQQRPAPLRLVQRIWPLVVELVIEIGGVRSRGGRLPRTYDAEFCRRVVEPVRAGRPVRVVAAELGLAEATVYWKAQDLVDRGLKPGTSTSERGELAAARQRIKELETEPALVSRPRRCSRRGCTQETSTRSSLVLAGQGSSAKQCCCILGVAASGFFMWRRRSPSPCQLRFAWLTELVRASTPTPVAPTAGGGSTPS
jgi:hypothetical protein